ncbi:pyridoxamine 5'-phosphate oxidase family protein [Actinophytocola sp.]|uniref:pyridoxamine 5'-phosphate oxidase family protein n=1 Tax=Actinophytocola sp. TaxID=1872138 RepID=UPI002D80AE9A|nr:pyridoxamine 5'-phosphate oxidase family protein [Actinophytocola sp.]HET9138215.1 pyridoxamine 5'-phosphate oxidase family protein [Actinophytocola sp.]
MGRRLIELPRWESLRLLGSVSYGRIVFTSQALPAVRPINHIVDDGAVVVRTHLGSEVLAGVGVVVAYEADEIDPAEHTGWSVIVTGLATLVRDPDEVARYTQLLRPWVNGERNQVLRIRPELVTGYRLAPEDVPLG